MGPVGAVAEGYAHEAVLYRGDDDFVGSTVPFVQEGLARDEAVLVAVIPPRIDLLRDALGDDAAGVAFVDMAELGANPARIIPAWAGFVAEQLETDRPFRGIGEPIWQGRRPEEIVECQIHEALLNLAVPPEAPFRLLCPYDTSALDQDVIEEALRTHPVCLNSPDGASRDAFAGERHALALMASPLPEPGPSAETVEFTAADLRSVRQAVSQRAAVLEPTRADELVLALHELAMNSVIHGGGAGTLRIWDEPDALVFEVTDAGHLDDPLAGRVQPRLDRDGGRGLWLANQMCDLVQVRTSADGGTAARVFAWR